MRFVRLIRHFVLAAVLSIQMAAWSAPTAQRALAPGKLPALNNRVASCLSLVPARRVAIHKLLVLELKSRLVQSLGKCGCMSAALSYRITEAMDVDGKNVEYERAFGLLAAPVRPGAAKTLRIALPSPKDGVGAGALSVEIDCKAPD